MKYMWKMKTYHEENNKKVAPTFHFHNFPSEEDIRNKLPNIMFNYESLRRFVYM